MMKKTLLFCGLIFSLTACHFNGEKDNLPLPIVAIENDDFSDVYVTPQVYAIAATRATNKMLDGTTNLYRKKEQKPRIFITEIQKINPKLPDGFHYARKVTEDIIEGSRNFVIVDNFADAQYQMDVLVNAQPNPGMDSPIITYELRLFDVNGTYINTWDANIKQLQNDDESWW